MSKPIKEPISPQRSKPGLSIEPLIYAIFAAVFWIWLGFVLVNGYERGNKALIDITSRIAQVVGR